MTPKGTPAPAQNRFCRGAKMEKRGAETTLKEYIEKKLNGILKAEQRLYFCHLSTFLRKPRTYVFAKFSRQLSVLFRSHANKFEVQYYLRDHLTKWILLEGLQKRIR